MGKVAKLVFFQVAKRVVVDECKSSELTEEAAINEAIKEMTANDYPLKNDICFDNVIDIVADDECPYGTFESDKD